MSGLIIHVSGPSGSGKTILGYKLKTQFKHKIIVKDLDDLRSEFINEYYGNKEWKYMNMIEYQKYINKYISQQNKPIVFVGLNGELHGNKKIKEFYYKVHAQYNFFIELDDVTINKQKCIRFLTRIQHDERAMDELANNNNRFVKLFSDEIKHQCSLKETIKKNAEWRKDYRKQRYQFMSRENIYKTVVKILNKLLN